VISNFISDIATKIINIPDDSFEDYNVFEWCNLNFKESMTEIENHSEKDLKLQGFLENCMLPVLMFLHDNDICHSDIKPAYYIFKIRNIMGLLSKNGNIIWKVADFDMAKHFGEILTGMTYTPPEAISALKRNYPVRASAAIDLFAVRCFIADIFSNYTFYQEAIQDINFNNRDIPIKIPTSVPKHWSKISELLDKDPVISF
jgi:serine/threonine protein kinase